MRIFSARELLYQNDALECTSFPHWNVLSWNVKSDNQVQICMSQLLDEFSHAFTKERGAFH
jgi:hypothetical protein